VLKSSSIDAAFGAQRHFWHKSFIKKKSLKAIHESRLNAIAFYRFAN
jgi:hypothetical protein